MQSNLKGNEGVLKLLGVMALHDGMLLGYYRWGIVYVKHDAEKLVT